MSISVSWNPGEAYFHYSGSVSHDQIQQAYGQHYHNSALFDNRHDQLHNYTEVTDFLLGINELRALAAIQAASTQSNPNIRAAFVASSEVITTLMQCYVFLLEEFGGFESQVFDSIDAAREWLGGK